VMYKTYQAYRALTRLDQQSSFMLFLIVGLYLDQRRVYLLLIFFLSDVLASRSLIKFIKHEDRRGAALSILAKMWNMAYWINVVIRYFLCYDAFKATRGDTAAFFGFERIPKFDGMGQFYDGNSGCISTEFRTIHDARTQEVVILNFAQAMLFRMVLFWWCRLTWRNFDQGLKDVFYKSVRTLEQPLRGAEAAEDAAGQADPEGADVSPSATPRT
jgi:hypothetical protein